MEMSNFYFFTSFAKVGYFFGGLLQDENRFVGVHVEYLFMNNVRADCWEEIKLVPTTVPVEVC